MRVQGRFPRAGTDFSAAAAEWVAYLEANESVSSTLADTYDVESDDAVEFFQNCLTALGLRVKIPKNLVFIAGQVFFLEGRVHEVRIVGKYERKGYTPSDLKTVFWPPPFSPNRSRIGKPRVHLAPAAPQSKVRRFKQGGLYLDDADAGRSHISVRRVVGKGGDTDRLLLSYRAQPIAGPVKTNTADAFRPDQLVSVPSNHFYSVLHRALAHRDRLGAWQTYDQGGRYFKFYEATSGETHESETKTMNDIPVRIIYSPKDASPSEIEDRFAAMSPDLVADIIDIFYARWIALNRPQWADLSLRQIITARGKEIQDFNVKSHGAAVNEARSLQLAVGSPTAGYAIFAFRITRGSQSETANNLCCPTRNQTFEYGAGNHLRHPTKSSIPQHQSNFYYPQLPVAFSRKVWELDPKKYSWAKRLVRALRVDWRRNAASYQSRSRFRTWRSILEEAGIDPHQRFRGEFRAFENALYKHLDTLHEINAIGANPGTDLRLYRSPHGKKIFSHVHTLEAFLDLEVCLPPPPDVGEHNRKYKQRRETTED